MGFYIETDCNTGKAARLIELYPDKVTRAGGLSSFDDIPVGKTAVCVVNNGLFEAAGITYDSTEFDEFNNPRDVRPKTWLLMDTDLAKELCVDYARYLN